MVTVNGHIIGERVGTKKMCFLVGNELVERFVALIEVDGKKMPVKDEWSASKCIDGLTRKEALKKAIEARDRIISRWSEERTVMS